MNAILDVDVPNRRVRVAGRHQPRRDQGGRAARPATTRPTRRSQQVCTIGGNVAENSGGAHCLKYGFTTNHVLAAEVVLADGDDGGLGDPASGRARPARRGGRLGGHAGDRHRGDGAAAAQPERCRRCSPTSRRPTRRARRCRRSSRAGIVPAAIEMMDKLAIEAAEEALHAGYPLDAGAVLLVELDGPAAEVRGESTGSNAICEGPAHRGARRADDGAARRRSGGAARRRSRRSAASSPDYFVQDGVVPRTRLPRCCAGSASRRGARAARRQRVPRGRRQPAPAGALRAPRRARPSRPRSSPRRSSSCARGGRVADGRARVGIDKARLDAADVHRGRSATRCTASAAASTRTGCATPASCFPTPRLCGEVPGPYRQHPLEREGVIDRW